MAEKDADGLPPAIEEVEAESLSARARLVMRGAPGHPGGAFKEPDRFQYCSNRPSHQDEA